MNAGRGSPIGSIKLAVNSSFICMQTSTIGLLVVKVQHTVSGIYKNVASCSIHCSIHLTLCINVLMYFNVF